jgi:hypothetical protein
MTTTTSPVLAEQTARRFGTNRVLLLIFGGITVLIAVALLAGGAFAAWGLTQRDDSGYFTSAAHRFSTGSFAIVSESFDVGTDVPSTVFGDRIATIRIEASADEPVFIGIARSRDVERYLADVAHDEISDLNTDPFSVDYRRLDGSGSPARPASQRFWRVWADGPGGQTITWPLGKGNWSAVAMNADGSRKVSADVRFAARVPFLRWLAIGLLAGGGLVLLGGGALVYFGARKPRPGLAGQEASS